MKLCSSFDFDAAHRLVGYKGKCKNIHGHMWKVELEIEGKESQLDEIGILMDFTIAKGLKETFDHKLILKDCDDNRDIIATVVDVCGEYSVVRMNNNPTAEYLALEILKILKLENSELRYLVRVFESPKSSVEVTG